MSSGLRGTNAGQDTRFKDKEAASIKATKFPPHFDQKVDLRKVNISVLRSWVATKITELLKFEDDVVVEYAYGLLENKDDPMPDPRKMQVNLTGFMDKHGAAAFVSDLWKLLLSAQNTVGGVPAEFIAAKKAELEKAQREGRSVPQDVKPDIGRSQGRDQYDGRRDNGRPGPPRDFDRDGPNRRPFDRDQGRGGYENRGQEPYGGRGRDNGYGGRGGYGGGRPRDEGYGGRGGDSGYAGRGRDSGYGARDGAGRPRSRSRSPRPDYRRRPEPPRRSPSPPRRRRSPSPAARQPSLSPPRKRRSPSPVLRRRSPSPAQARERSITPPLRRGGARQRSPSASPSPPRRRAVRDDPPRGRPRSRTPTPSDPGRKSRSRSRSPTITPPRRRRRSSTPPRRRKNDDTPPRARARDSPPPRARARDGSTPPRRREDSTPPRRRARSRTDSRSPPPKRRRASLTPSRSPSPRVREEITKKGRGRFTGDSVDAPQAAGKNEAGEEQKAKSKPTKKLDGPLARSKWAD